MSEEHKDAQRRMSELGMQMLDQVRPMVETIVGMRHQLIDGGFPPEDASRIAAEIIIDAIRKGSKRS